MNIRKWKFWRKVQQYAQKEMRNAWFEGGNCDSACYNCKLWESHGNHINTKALDDGTEKRTCSNCGYSWRTVFTPVGFMRIDE